MATRLRRRSRGLLGIVLAGALASAGCAAHWAYSSGSAAAQRGDWEKALARLTKAADKSPRNVRYRLALENARARAGLQHATRAREFDRAGDLDRATEEMEVAANFDPTSQVIADELRDMRTRIREREEQKRAEADEARRARGRIYYPLPELSPRSQKPIALRFRDASLQKVLEHLGKVAGVNVLLDPEYKDKQVTVELMGVTFEEALDQITLANRLFYKVVDQNTLLVVQDNPAKRKMYEDVLVQTFFMANVNDEKEFPKMAQAAAKLAGITKTHVDATLGAVTLVGTPDRLALAEKVLEAYDKPRGEVMVEVQIIEVNRTKTRKYGINLSNYIASATLAPSSDASVEQGIRAHLLSSLNLSDFIVKIPSSLIAQLSQTGGAARLLASPRLRAAEGETAKLQIASKVPIAQTSFYSYGSQTGGGGAGAFPYSPTTSFQYQDVGVTLDITPRISSADEVALKIKAEFSSLGAPTNVGTEENQFFIPEILTRKIEGTIRVKDGEATLLGGLIQNRDNLAVGGLMGLQSIPLLNRIFGSTEKNAYETEILLSLTPRIVRAPRITAQDRRPLHVGTEQNPRVREARRGLFGAPTAEDEPAGERDAAPAPSAPSVERPTQPPAAEAQPATSPRGVLADTSVAPPDALFSPAQLGVAMGEGAMVSVVVRRARSVRAVELDLDFDPALVQLENVMPGALLTLGGRTPSVSATQPAPGQLRARLAVPAEAPAAGSGVVATFVLRGTAAGATNVRLVALRLIGEAGTEALVGTSVPPLAVTVGPGRGDAQGGRP